MNNNKNNNTPGIITINAGTKLPDVIENKAKRKKVEQFRKSNKACGHISYVYEKQGDTLSYLSMTHTPPEETKEKYKSLTHSVDPNDNEPAYINTVADKDHFSNFGPKKVGYHFDDKDIKMVRKIVRKNKKSEK